MGCRLAVLVAMAGVLAAGGAGTDSNPGVVAPPAPAVQHGEIDIDGVPRHYRLFVPTTLDRRQPTASRASEPTACTPSRRLPGR